MPSLRRHQILQIKFNGTLEEDCYTKTLKHGEVKVTKLKGFSKLHIPFHPLQKATGVIAEEV